MISPVGRLVSVLRRAGLSQQAAPGVVRGARGRCGRPRARRASGLRAERALDFVSARVRNHQVHPYWGRADHIWPR
jgi:hypothetical protein